MKICQVVPSLEARHGGPSRSVQSLAAALAQLGHEVDLFTTDPGPRAERREGALRVAHFPRGWPATICPSRDLRDAIAGSDAGVFHHHALWLRTLHYVHRRTRRGGAFVLSPRGAMGAWAWGHHARRKAFARAFVHPGAFEAVDGWHATSAAEEADIRRLGFRQPVCVAPNGVGAPDPNASAAAATYWRETCPATARRPVALFYSRFHPKKRVLELIDTWAKQAPSEWLLLLVGIPEAYTVEELGRHALNRAGPGRIAVFAGEGRPPPYAVASLFLLPSHDENFGLAIAEALAHGVPPLVTDTTPWQALNEDGRGWCVPWAEYGEALQAATAEARTQREARGARGRDWVRREFSWEASARRLVDFYARLQRS